jgi:3-phosphoshikimate 1-carboxyvinyltransferase
VARRPMGRVVEPLRRMGADIDGRDGGNLAPLVVRGGSLSGIDYAPPVASAQVKSAILLAGVGAAGETIVREAVATRAHTEELLALAGADLDIVEGGDGRAVRVRASRLQPFDLDVPGDPSQAAFWVVAACITPASDLRVEGVYLGPARTGFLDVLRRMGADLEVDDAGTIRARSSALAATTIDGAELPGLDEVPVLAVAAACATGTTTITGAAELRLKESDRVATTTGLLAAMGVPAEARADGLVVHGGAGLRPGRVSSEGDHRVAMAGAVAALAAEGETTVTGWECVATSYPGFEDVLATAVGGDGGAAIAEEAGSGPRRGA